MNGMLGKNSSSESLMVNLGRRVVLSIFISLFLGLPQLVQAKDAPQTNKPLKVLFIGNSYTYWIEDVLQFVLERSSYSKSSFEFHTRGSTPLAYFAEDQATKRKIAEGGFDYVVLQEWSKGVGRGGETAEQFEKSLTLLTKTIRASGAAPLLYMTWGRDDAEGYDNYTDMNAKIIAGYERAGSRHDVEIFW